MQRSAWPAMKLRFAEVFRTRTRDEWTAVFAGSDACVTPVLTPEEAAQHPQALARGSFSRSRGVLHPGAVPHFSRSATGAAGAPPLPGEQSAAVLESFGFSAEESAQLLACGAATQAARRGTT